MWSAISSLLGNNLIQAALISAASHLVVWGVSKLPGGYSSAKRAFAVKALAWLASAQPKPENEPKA